MHDPEIIHHPHSQRSLSTFRLKDQNKYIDNTTTSLESAFMAAKRLTKKRKCEPSNLHTTNFLIVRSYKQFACSRPGKSANQQTLSSTSSNFICAKPTKIGVPLAKQSHQTKNPLEIVPVVGKIEQKHSRSPINPFFSLTLQQSRSRGPPRWIQGSIKTKNRVHI